MILGSAKRPRFAVLFFLFHVLLPLSLCSLFLFTRSAFHPHGLCPHKPSVLHRSLSVHSLCFLTPWFVSSQTIHSEPFSFCSLALLSIPMVCVFTNQRVDRTLFSLLNICTCDDVQPRWQPGTMCGVQRELR
jgi:hypothetical protein